MGLRSLRADNRNAEAVPLLRAMDRANEEIADTLRDLLDLLLLDLEEPAPGREPVSLDAVFDALGAVHAVRAEAAGVRLRIAASRIVLHTDRRLLTRLLGNLVANAVAHSGCSRIVLGARLRAGLCTIEVVDNGKGMPAAQVSRLVGTEDAGPAPSQRGDETRGLGLYIVRRFAVLLGAEVAVQSQPARGTCVRVGLAGAVKRHPRQPRLPGDKPRPLAGRLVALIDDQREVLDSMRMAFELLGATVVAADDDLTFISEVMHLETLPDLFVVDFMLGRSTADRCLRILKSRFGADKLKVAIVTGLPAHSGLAQWTDIPVFEKPLTDESFRRIVEIIVAT